MVDIIAGIKNISLQLVSAVTKGEMTAASREAIGPPQFPIKEFLPIHIPRWLVGTYSARLANNDTSSAPNPNPISARVAISMMTLGVTAARYIEIV